MKECVKKEIEKIIKDWNLDCSVEEFRDNIKSLGISFYEGLSEDFIREFQDNVNWPCISEYQDLSEDFIREFKDKVYWGGISIDQYLSLGFVSEFQNKLDEIDWEYIGRYQNITKKDIEEYEKQKLEEKTEEKLEKTKVKNKLQLIRF